MVLLLIGLFAPVFGQDSRAIANAKYEYTKAEESYGEGDYKGCLKHLDKSQSFRGNNILIQYLRCKAKFAMLDIKGTEIEVNRFYKMAPNDAASDPRFMEIVEIERSINEKYELEEELYQDAIRENSIELYEAYLAKYEYGRYVKQVKMHMQNAYEKVMFNQVKNKGTIASLEDYMSKIESGQRYDSISQAYNRLENAMYSECITDPTIPILERYMTEFNHQEHKVEIEKKLNEIREDDLFKKASEGNNVIQQKLYLLTYPEGRYSSEVRTKLESTLLSNAKRQYQISNFIVASTYCEDYLLYFPTGRSIMEMKSTLSECYMNQAAIFLENKDYLNAFAFDYSYYKFFTTGSYHGEASKNVITEVKKFESDQPYKLKNRKSVATYYLTKNNFKLGAEHFKGALVSNNLSEEDIISFLFHAASLDISDPTDQRLYVEIANLVFTNYSNSPLILEACGELLYSKGEFIQAHKYFATAWTRDRTLERSCLRICQIHMTSRNFNGLIEHSNEALKYFANSGIVYGYMGRAHYYLGKYSESLEFIETGLANTNSEENGDVLAWLMCYQGASYHKLNDYKKADAVFADLFSKAPYDAYALSTYSFQLGERNENLLDMLEMTKIAVEVDYKSPLTMASHAYALYKNGKIQEASTYMSTAESLAKKNHSHLNGLILERKGDILYKMNNKNEALNAWIEAQNFGGGSDLLAKKINEKKLYE